MAKASEWIRKPTTFLLAVFLWLHGLFLLNLQPAFLAHAVRMLYFTSSEVTLFALLVLFSLLAASGFWRMIRSVAYIYFFPFVLCWYLIYWLFRGLRLLNRWFKSQVAPQTGHPIVLQQAATAPLLAAPEQQVLTGNSKPRSKGFLRFLSRPFRRFTLLWCILLLLSTHRAVIWLCLFVVSLQLCLKIFFVLRVMLFSDAWQRKYGPLAFAGLKKSIETLESVTPDISLTNELKGLIGQLDLWRRVLAFLRNPFLISRWAWVLGIAVFGSIYIYFSILFSFEYYGIARASGILYKWPDSLITSLFIPFFVADLPKLLAIRLVGGIHCSLVVIVGIGTVLNFLRRKLTAVRNAATELSDRLAEQSLQEKYMILQAKVAAVGQGNLGSGKGG